MCDEVGAVQVREIVFIPRKGSGRFEGIVFTGSGREVVERIGRETSQSGAAVLDSIVHHLLVKKGADWTNIILSEYLELYDDSAGVFSLVWDKASRQLVAHGSAFRSRAHPGAALVAHIRTDESYQGLGLGTLVTEEVTRSSIEHGAQLVVLGTDDKRYRVEQGERAAFRMYAKLGYTILAEKQLTDTIEWLMVVDRAAFERCRQERGTVAVNAAPNVSDMQRELVEGTRERFSRELLDGLVSPVGEGDLANLFLLMNLCPPQDFQLKLVPWGVHLGPEMERCYIVNVRPAIADRDRLEVAALALRDRYGAILAVCAAQRVFPFTQNAMSIDFYCLPRFMAANQSSVVALVRAVLSSIEQSTERPSPCRILFSGIDAEKIQLFQDLGFTPTQNTHPYFNADGTPAFQACEYEKTL
jgi:ribosomal protein S18 acetylase RimI-like enzyme